MFVFFDIGFTLIGGPPVGPARRIIDALKIAEEEKPTLADALFRQPFAQAEELADFLVNQYGTPINDTHAISKNIWDAQIQEAYPLPGAVECLSRLKKAHIPFGFISNIWSPFYAGFARLFPEESATMPNFLSFQHNCAKPDLALYQTALDQVDIPAEQAIMVGDTYVMDIASPRQLGMKTVWILHRPQKELPEIIKTLNGTLPPPDLTLAHVGLLSVEQLPRLLEGHKKP